MKKTNDNNEKEYFYDENNSSFLIQSSNPNIKYAVAININKENEQLLSKIYDFSNKEDCNEIIYISTCNIRHIFLSENKRAIEIVIPTSRGYHNNSFEIIFEENKKPKVINHGFEKSNIHDKIDDPDEPEL